ncbi:MAG: c-type cytochrome [Woeseia sp.]|nr:c-type cytochrome [Woeseia sp.]NNE61212.1 c-type cytochrome [Woeseia sp.]NNL55833.1 c-type cytochrome [Woeseia sp.]
MPLAVVLILLVVGSLIFHFLSPWTFTPLASNWGQIDFTIDITFVVTGIVFVAVNLFMAWCVIRYRARAGHKARYDPENQKLEWILTIATTIGVAAMLAPGLWVWAKFVDVPADAQEIEAVGQQWHWSYRLPGEDGEFGTVHNRLVSLDNPFGIDPDDPNGQDDILVASPEIHIPLGQPVKFNLRSKDVLHNFTVAQFRVKMDLVPGMETYMWLTPTEPGRYEVLCEELCGIAHFAMRGAVIVDDEADYTTWLASTSTFAETQAVAAGNADIGRAQYAVCAACHGQQGEGLELLNGPKLAGQSKWYLRNQIHAYQNGLRGANENDTYGRQMAPMAMTLANESALNNVIAYIQTLPDTPAPETIGGNAAAGEKTYEICAYCHGTEGQGIYSMNAPRLAGMSDWYLKRQLANFRDGVRGAHPKDYYGMQMGFMAQTFRDEKVMNDVIAYIHTL